MPTFQHLPSPVGKIARAMVSNDYLVPAPAFLRALINGRGLNNDSPNAYLLGRVRAGGWWYFFLVGIAVKTPLPLLVLSVVGTVYGLTNTRQVNWMAIAPAAAVLGILFITCFVKYNAGVRHVLVVFPLIAILAGQGAAWLWQKGTGPNLRRTIPVLLIAWQAVETARAQPDFLAYFNELAGKDPSRVMVTGCDLDCGQDLFRLSAEAKKRNITHLKLAVWTSADLQRMQLPDFEVLQPYKPATGWIAISARALRFGRRTAPNTPDAFGWLDRFQPAAQVGKTIELYYISERP